VSNVQGFTMAVSQYNIQFSGIQTIIWSRTPKKTKAIIIDFRRSKKTTHSPLSINGEEVESVNYI